MSRYLNRKSDAQPSPLLALPTIALTIQQPWAAFFFLTKGGAAKLGVDGPKNIENRSWKPPQSQLDQGQRVWIHAGKTLDKAAFDYFDIDPTTCTRRGMLLGHCCYDGLVVDTNVEWRNDEKYGWKLVDPVRTPDVACNGAQGLWWPRQDTLAEMRRLIEVRAAEEKLGIAQPLRGAVIRG